MFGKTLVQYSCPSCGAITSSAGECSLCRNRTQHQRGFDDGMRSRGLLKPPRFTPPPIDLRSDYQKGFDAGSGRDSLGCPGEGAFVFTGG